MHVRSLPGAHRLAAVLAPLVLACNLLAIEPTRWERGTDGCPPGSIAQEWPTASPADAGLAAGPLEEIAERVAVLSQGRLIAYDTIAGLRQRAGSTGPFHEVYERLTNPQTLENIERYFAR